MTRVERRRKRTRAARIKAATLTVASIILVATCIGLETEFLEDRIGSPNDIPKVKTCEVWNVMEIIVRGERSLSHQNGAISLAEDVTLGDYENEKIEAALLEQRYFRDDIPLSYDEQDYLHTACEEFGVPYALALAVIQKETHFQNIMGDDGASSGYMQVQKRWHRERMESLGVTDLMDPFSNFRVGCDFLSELLKKYTMTEALTAYNSGSPGCNDYSKEVIRYYEEWKELVGEDDSGIKS